MKKVWYFFNSHRKIPYVVLFLQWVRKEHFIQMAPFNTEYKELSINISSEKKYVFCGQSPLEGSVAQMWAFIY